MRKKEKEEIGRDISTNGGQQLRQKALKRKNMRKISNPERGTTAKEPEKRKRRRKVSGKLKKARNPRNNCDKRTEKENRDERKKTNMED